MFDMPVPGFPRTKEDLKAMEPAVGVDGVEVYSFDKYYHSPSGGLGVITLDPLYRRLNAQNSGTDVGVSMDIIAVTNIDSLAKIVGLKIFLRFDWEDNRLHWPIGEPGQNQEWEFDTEILK